MAKRLYSTKTRRNTLGRKVEYAALYCKIAHRQLLGVFRKVDRKLIVFESFAGRSYSCSPKAIYESMCSDVRFKDCTFVWAFRNPESYKYMTDERTKVIRSDSKEYYKIFAIAGTWIVNSKPPLDIPKRHDQVMVQCSHGTPFKRLRADVVRDTENAVDSYDDMPRQNSIDAIRYDYFVSPSRFTSEKFISSFKLEEMGKTDIVIETGYPRNDRLKTFPAEAAADIKKRLNISTSKKVILYAPTWRDDQFSEEKGFVFKPTVDFEHLREVLSSEYIILYRAHYLIANTFDFSAFEGFVYDVSSVDDINDLYIISDALVTDYSSVFFDYANLQRPILFYMYDREHYRNDLRGFYLEPHELPGETVTTETELVQLLTDLPAYTERNSTRLKKFSKRFNYLDDGKAAERVVEEVFFRT